MYLLDPEVAGVDKIENRTEPLKTCSLYQRTLWQ